MGHGPPWDSIASPTDRDILAASPAKPFCGVLVEHSRLEIQRTGEIGGNSNLMGPACIFVFDTRSIYRAAALYNRWVAANSRIEGVERAGIRRQTIVVAAN